jgi:hypothetical protein
LQRLSPGTEGGVDPAQTERLPPVGRGALVLLVFFLLALVLLFVVLLFPLGAAGQQHQLQVGHVPLAGGVPGVPHGLPADVVALTDLFTPARGSFAPRSST